MSYLGHSLPTARCQRVIPAQRFTVGVDLASPRNPPLSGSSNIGLSRPANASSCLPAPRRATSPGHGSTFAILSGCHRALRTPRSSAMLQSSLNVRRSPATLTLCWTRRAGLSPVRGHHHLRKGAERPRTALDGAEGHIDLHTRRQALDRRVALRLWTRRRPGPGWVHAFAPVWTRREVRQYIDDTVRHRASPSSGSRSPGGTGSPLPRATL